MATMITTDCINCGACEPECPNTAIYQGGVEWEMNGVKHPPLSQDVFYIVPEKCTECVGFHDQEACAAVCPVDVCIPNPDIPETEEQLIVRAKQLHPGTDFGSDFPSRFRAEGAAAPAPSAATPASATAAPQAPATAAVAQPPAAPAAAAPRAGLGLPSMEEWEIPIDCRSCKGTYAVAYKHIRSGVVLRCPFCTATHIVTTEMHGGISRAMESFHRRWIDEFETFEDKRRREITEFEESRRAELEAFNDSLKSLSASVRPPGAPRKRAWIFG